MVLMRTTKKNTLFIGDQLFTGDTLFEHGWGRTDLPGGDEHALFTSLRRLIPLAKSMPIHPGHAT